MVSQVTCANPIASQVARHIPLGLSSDLPLVERVTLVHVYIAG